MNGWLSHFPILPIVLPMAAGAIMLFLGDNRRPERALIAVLSAVAQVAVALVLLAAAGGALPERWPDGIAVYLLGNWRAPFGIVLVVDRLTAIMLALNAALGLASLLYSMSRWDRRGAHFQPLFQFLMMGVNGAFLTGDLFNLFVFFEVLLAASYGLLLHGSGAPRIQAALHYIAVNLAASFLFLLGAALIYGVTGTLNMADLAARLPGLARGDRVLFEAGAVLLGLAFLVKAGAWPLNFWLPTAYASAGAPIAAMFSIMTKVGVYAMLRVGSLLAEADTPFLFRSEWLAGIGLATLALGSLGMLAAQQSQRLVAYAVIVSAGTLLAAFGVGGAAVTGMGLFYLVSSVLATGAFFMLCELMERSRRFGASVLAVTLDSFGVDEPLDPERPDEVVGVVIPAGMAFLGLGFISCALVVAGLPPLSGFVGKFGMLAAALDSTRAGTPPAAAWALMAALLGSGLAGTIALSRMGTRIFWNPNERLEPRPRITEAGAIAGLLLLIFAMALGAGPVADYMLAASQALYTPQDYIDAVLSAGTARAGGTAGGGS